MTTEPPYDDVKAIWRDQKTEVIPMPIAELRLKAEQLQKRVRRRNRIEYVASVFVVLAFGFWAWCTPFSIVRLGSVLVVLGTFLMVYQLHRRGSAVEPPAGASASSYLSFHREQLARQRDALRSVWLWYLGPLVPGIVLLMVALVPSPRFHGHWLSIILGLIPTIVVIIAVLLLNRWGARRLQTQIDALDALRVDS